MGFFIFIWETVRDLYLLSYVVHDFVVGIFILWKCESVRMIFVSFFVYQWIIWKNVFYIFLKRNSKGDWWLLKNIVIYILWKI